MRVIIHLTLHCNDFHPHANVSLVSIKRVRLISRRPSSSQGRPAARPSCSCFLGKRVGGLQALLILKAL